MYRFVETMKASYREDSLSLMPGERMQQLPTGSRQSDGYYAGWLNNQSECGDVSIDVGRSWFLSVVPQVRHFTMAWPTS